MVDNKIIGNFISKLRKNKGLTQQEFAIQLNVTHQAVSKWENGIALPDTEMLINIADIFGIKIDDILNAKSNNMYDIKFEFGYGLVPYLDIKKEESLLHKIGALRTKLNLETGKEIPIIHVLDNGNLNELEYRISINGQILMDNQLNMVPEVERTTEMLSFLKFVIKSYVLN